MGYCQHGRPGNFEPTLVLKLLCSFAKRGIDAFLDLDGLQIDQHPTTHCAFLDERQHHIHGCRTPNHRKFRHVRVYETRSSQSPTTFVMLTETEQWGGWGHRNRHISMRLNGPKQQRKVRGAFGRRTPNREGISTARRQDSIRFSQRPFGLGNVQQTKVADNGIEAGIVEWQGLGIPFTKFYQGVVLAGFRPP